MKLFVKLAAIGGLLLALGACTSSGELPFPDDTASTTTTTTGTPPVAQARSNLQRIELAATVAELGYDAICAGQSAPKTCTDPQAVAVYTGVKALLASAFQTADDALATNGTLTQADITKLVTDATVALGKLETVIADIKAGKTPAPVT